MQKKPEIIVFAGPNGSGKSTVTKMAKVIRPYINADDIKLATGCSDMDAAILVDAQRNDLVDIGESFTFETVLSTDRNIKLLKRAKERGFFIRCIYVLTIDPLINVDRVTVRYVAGGHDVPKDKIIGRYRKSLALIPELIKVCDICHIYDNTITPKRIFKKRKDECFYWETTLWNKQQIIDLTKVETVKQRGY